MNDEMLKIQWDITEDLQEKFPHLRFGWYGFIPMVYEDDKGTAKNDKKTMVMLCGCLP